MKRGIDGIAVHVADGIDMDHGRDAGDDHQHHGGQLVDAQRPMRLEAAGPEPGRSDLRRARRGRDAGATSTKTIQASTMEASRARQVTTWAPWSPIWRQNRPGDGGRDQRQEDDHDVHRAAQPFIMLMSSTAMEPRLRK